MKRFASRALQIMEMSQDQMERLHGLEVVTNYVIPNWNIQALFNLSTIKEFVSLSEDTESQVAYMIKITNMLKEKNFIKFEEEVSVDGGNVEVTHSFDRMVMMRKEEMDISANVATSGKSRLRKFIESKNNQGEEL